VCRTLGDFSNNGFHIGSASCGCGGLSVLLTSPTKETLHHVNDATQDGSTQQQSVTPTHKPTSTIRTVLIFLRERDTYVQK
jgi:hypothetical protein